MLTSLVILCLLPQDGALPYDLNWTNAEANLRVPDPTQPNAVPDLGYVGLWRTIFGDRDPRDILKEDEHGFVSRFESSSFSADGGGPDVTTLFEMRRPRLAAARRASIVQQYSDMPSFTVSRKDLDPEVAAFLLENGEQPEDDGFVADQNGVGGGFSVGALGTPRDYVPNNIVDDKSNEDWTEAVEEKNLALTITVAVIAVALFGVIIFMPK